MNTIESRMEELRKQHVEEIRECENHVATLTMGEAGGSSSTPIAPKNINLQSLQTKRDTTLQEAKIANS